MSERTLGRRLSERGLSFRGLLDGVRKELGLGYMDELRHAITDVAYLLGFFRSVQLRAFVPALDGVDAVGIPRVQEKAPNPLPPKTAPGEPEA